MKLYNSFSVETRLLYIGIYSCWQCNSNQMLEIHHIMGRRKHMHCLSSALNSALLCKRCHDKVKHSLDEHRQLFFKTLKFLKKSDYQLKPVDIEFMNMNAFELIGKDIELWAIN